MTGKYWLVLVPFLLACTVLAPAAQPVTITHAVVTQTSTTNAPETPSVTATTPATVTMDVTGCWNIRKYPSVNGAQIRYQCGGTVDVKGWSVNGFIELADGLYICNQAIGDNELCR